MTTLKTFLLHIFWPIKGIIFMEVYLATWLFWMLWHGYKDYGQIVIILGAVAFAVAVTFDFVCGLKKFGKRLIIGLIRSIFRVITIFFRAWYFLLVGLIRGSLQTDANQHVPKRLERAKNGHLEFKDIPVNRLPIHYRMGRGIYRFFFRVFAVIPRINTNRRLVNILARTMGLLIALWGVWNIPEFLTT